MLKAAIVCVHVVSMPTCTLSLFWGVAFIPAISMYIQHVMYAQLVSAVQIYVQISVHGIAVIAINCKKLRIIIIHLQLSMCE